MPESQKFLPNPDKPEPKLTAKTTKETMKIEIGGQELTELIEVLSEQCRVFFKSHTSPYLRIEA